MEGSTGKSAIYLDNLQAFILTKLCPHLRNTNQNR